MWFGEVSIKNIICENYTYVYLKKYDSINESIHNLESYKPIYGQSPSNYDS